MIDTAVQTLHQAFSGNEYFAGMVGAGALFALGFLARRVPVLLAKAAERQFVINVEIRERDLVRWLELWLKSQPYGRRCRRLKASTFQDPAQDDSVPSVLLAPGEGQHLVRHRGKLFLVSRNREDKGGGGSSSSEMSLADLLEMETVTIRTLGRSAEPVRLLLAAARETANAHLLESQEMQVYTNRYGSEWSSFVAGRTRPLSSVILPSGVLESVVADIETFLSSRDWYQQRGVPYRRGYLLHGPPGGGKSSLVRALASDLDLGLYVLNLTARNLTDTGLAALLADVPPKSLVLAEDIDCLRVSQQRKEGAGSTPEGQVTLSGVLNAFDGAMAAEGRILVLTTNHPERLDDALIRVGRVDLSIEIGRPVAEQAARLFLRFFPGDNRADEFGQFAVQIPGVSMASLQGLLLQHHESPAEALAQARRRSLDQPSGQKAA